MTRMLTKVGVAIAGASIGAAALTVPTATVASGVPQCATSQLHIALGPFNGGVGHGGYPIRFTNTGSTCSMFGYPGVDGLAANGSTVVHAQRTLFGYLGGTHKETRVTVTHGQTASALLEGLNFAAQGQPCHAFKALLVTPPNQTRSVKVSRASSVCYPQIHPVVPGGSGIQQSGLQQGSPTQQGSGTQQ
jgi:hypothetical protein